MYFFLNHILEILLGALALQISISAYLLICNRRTVRETRTMEREIFGLMKRIEGLTASGRERMLKTYDRILEELEHKLPEAVAAKAGELMNDTETKILTRLAEIEPNLHGDLEGQRKFDDLLVTMERLEQTVVETASDAVRHVVDETRQAFSELDPDLRQ
jgi:hypothetical protein